jgi:hypothetical protein
MPFGAISRVSTPTEYTPYFKDSLPLIAQEEIIACTAMRTSDCIRYWPQLQGNFMRN